MSYICINKQTEILTTLKRNKMETLNLNNSTKAEDFLAIANEACTILNANSAQNQDFQVDGEDIIEYDLSEEIDPINWKIVTVAWNEDGTASQVNLDC